MATFLFIVGALCLLNACNFPQVIAGSISLVCALIMSGVLNSIFGACQ